MYVKIWLEDRGVPFLPWRLSAADRTHAPVLFVMMGYINQSKGTYHYCLILIVFESFERKV